MIEGKKIAVVVPAYNEENKIGAMLDGLPETIDAIYVANDKSTDRTADIVREKAAHDKRITLLDLPENVGVGGAIVAGYKAVIDNDEDIAVVMAGDGQMDPSDLPAIINPVARDECDYSKGNRFLHGRRELDKIPRHRLFGNLVLSMLTKIVSGYWHVSDSQGGYTAINRKALQAVDWDKCYPRYGCPNDYLVQLNIANMRVCDVPITAVYGEEWQSKMTFYKVIFPILGLLFRLFMRRIFIKYAVRDGHPIVFSYLFAALGVLATIFFLLYILIKFAVTGVVPQTASIFFGLSMIVSVQLLLNSFEMDYRYNEWLCIRPKS